jgi:hypothetical protein
VNSQQLLRFDRELHRKILENSLQNPDTIIDTACSADNRADLQ